jgi:hypothetical protein
VTIGPETGAGVAAVVGGAVAVAAGSSVVGTAVVGLAAVVGDVTQALNSSPSSNSGERILRDTGIGFSLMSVLHPAYVGGTRLGRDLEPSPEDERGEEYPISMNGS